MLPRQFTVLTEFLQRRFSPAGYLGLHVTIGVFCFIAASWVFATIAGNVAAADPTNTIMLLDMQIAQWFHAHATPWITRWMLTITYLHSTAAMIFYVVLIGLFLAKKRDWHWLITLLVTVPGGMLLNVAMKHIFQRARPLFNDPLLTLSTYSFPSGHTAATTVLYGVLAAYIICHMKPWRWPLAIAVVTMATIMVALIGLSRMYLGVHYLSDVLGATVEGIAWLALCLTVATSWRKHRAIIM
ncbi:MAG: phosphatase PAP2 family protein [Burkholderiaceae bacterium]